MRSRLLVLIVFVMILGKASFCQWQMVNTGISDKFVDACFINDSTALVISANGKVLKSTDSGLNWALVNTLTGTFTSICAGNRDTIYAAGEKIYQSTDAGQSWTLKASFPNVVKDLLFFDARRGYLLMPNTDLCKIGSVTNQIDDYQVFETNDYGGSWNLRFGRISSTALFCRADSLTAYLTGVNEDFVNICEVFPGSTNRKTSDGGQTWTIIPQPEKNTTLTSFIGSDTGFYVNLPQFLKTYDGGSTANNSYTVFPPEIIKQSLFLNKYEGYLLSASNIFITKSGGLNWTNDFSINKNLEFFFWNKKNTLICIGDSGMILRKTIVPATSPAAVYRIKPDQNSVDFGWLMVNTEVTRNLSVKNTGNVPLKLHLNTSTYFTLSVNGTSYSFNDSISINPFDSAMIYLKLTPLIHYHYTGELTISADSLEVTKIPLSGFGNDGIMGTLLKDTLICKDTLRILNQLTIGANTKLSICPGTKVIVLNDAVINVIGRFYAVGDSANPIDFETENTQQLWKGFVFNHDKSDTSEFRYCTFHSSCHTNLMTAITGHLAIDHCVIGGIYPVHNSIILNDPNNMFVSNSLTLTNSTISHVIGYSVQSNGGPVYMYNNDIHHNTNEVFVGNNIRGRLVAKNNKVHDNQSLGFYIYDHGIVTDNEIYNNNGGGIYVYWGRYVLIKNNVIYGNKTKGGISCRSNGKADIIQNLIVNNLSILSGAGLLLTVQNDDKQSQVINNTICNNLSYDHDGSNLCVSDYGKTKVIIQNNIIWDITNSTTTIRFATQAHIDLSYNCMNSDKLSSYGVGNIYYDPEFVHPTTYTGARLDTAVYDWSPGRTSWCINAGNPAVTDEKKMLDFIGNPRVFGTAVDMGAYEYQGYVRMHHIPDTTVAAIECIYPNPVGDYLKISLNNDAEIDFIIYDLASAFIRSERFSVFRLIFVGDLSKGLYFYEIRKDQELLSTGKFVKE